MKRFNGKPMAHWEAMAKKLVVDSLVRASLGLDGSGASLPGKMASERLMAIALAENAGLVQEVLGERDRFQAGMAKILSAAWKPQRKKKA